jgi:hypothetical protein
VTSAIASAEGWKYFRTFSGFLCRDFAISISARVLSPVLDAALKLTCLNNETHTVLCRVDDNTPLVAELPAVAQPSHPSRPNGY